MNSKERLIRPRDFSAKEPMAARAVALCEGCPMAKFCVVKTVAPCETISVREMHIEAGGGGYDGSMPDKPVRTSYRDDLLNPDPSKNLVMAELQRLRKPKEVIQPPPTPRSPVPVVSLKRKPQTPLRPPVVQAKPVPRIERSGEGSAGILAGIIASMVGVKDASSSSTQKRV